MRVVLFAGAILGAFSGLRMLGIEWDYALFVVAALAFVVRDELRSKFATTAEKELHERVAKLELRWNDAAEMDHIQALNKRCDDIEKRLPARKGKR